VLCATVESNVGWMREGSIEELSENVNEATMVLQKKRNGYSA
jgi:hypothetical protein